MHWMYLSLDECIEFIKEPKFILNVMLILSVTTVSNQEQSILDRGHWGPYFKVLEDIKHLLEQKLNRNNFVSYLCFINAGQILVYY